jgi:hypothetical protein
LSLTLAPCAITPVYSGYHVLFRSPAPIFKENRLPGELATSVTLVLFVVGGFRALILLSFSLSMSRSSGSLEMKFMGMGLGERFVTTTCGCGRTTAVLGR